MPNDEDMSKFEASTEPLIPDEGWPPGYSLAELSFWENGGISARPVGWNHRHYNDMEQAPGSSENFRRDAYGHYFKTREYELEQQVADLESDNRCFMDGIRSLDDEVGSADEVSSEWMGAVELVRFIDKRNSR